MFHNARQKEMTKQQRGWVIFIVIAAVVTIFFLLLFLLIIPWINQQGGQQQGADLIPAGGYTDRFDNDASLNRIEIIDWFGGSPSATIGSIGGASTLNLNGLGKFVYTLPTLDQSNLAGQSFSFKIYRESFGLTQTVAMYFGSKFYDNGIFFYWQPTYIAMIHEWPDGSAGTPWLVYPNGTIFNPSPSSSPTWLKFEFNIIDASTFTVKVNDIQMYNPYNGNTANFGIRKAYSFTGIETMNIVTQGFSPGSLSLAMDYVHTSWA